MKPLALALLLLPAAASAQLSGGGDNPQPAGGRPQSTRVGFFELLKSGGEAFLELFAGQTEAPTAEDPKWDSTDGPRAAAMTFVEAMGHVAEGKDGALPRALTTFPEGVGGRQEALDLLYVFDRLPKLSPGSIPSAGEMEARGATRYELFPRGVQRDWAYVAVDGLGGRGIVLEQADGGRWRFTEETVTEAAKLLKAMRPIPPRPRIEERGEMFKEIVGPTFSETPLTGWLFFAGVLAAAVLAAWLLWKALTKAADFLRDKQDFLISPLLSGLRVPAVVLVLAVGLLMASSRVHLEPTLDNFRWKIVETLMVLAGAWAGVILVELALLGGRRLFGGDGDDPYAQMATSVFRQALRVVVGGALLLFVVQNVFDWNVTALIGGVGLLALALSLAAKDAVANLFGAATIFAGRPFLVGDWIIFQKRIGVVDDVQLQNTTVRLLTGELWSVPNMLFVDTPVENLSRREYLRRVMKIAVTYGTPADKVERAIEVLREILSSDAVVGDGQGDLEKYAPEVYFTEFEDCSLIIRADYWYLMDPDGTDIQRHTDRGYITWLAHCSTVNTLVLRRFNEEGIDFAFPTRTLHVEGPEPGEPVAVAT